MNRYSSNRWRRAVPLPDLEQEHSFPLALLDVNPGICLELMVAEGKAKLKDLEAAM